MTVVLSNARGAVSSFSRRGFWLRDRGENESDTLRDWGHHERPKLEKEGMSWGNREDERDRV